MQHRHISLYRKGFISAATMIIMTASLGIALTVLYRSVQGQSIVSNLKQSNQAYQDSDTNAESALQKFRKIDEGTYSGVGLEAAKKIPENTLAEAFCSNNGITCYKNGASGGTVKITSTDMLSSVTRISAEGSTASTTRAIQAPVLDRVDTLDTTLLDVPASSTAVNTNTNAVQITWDIPNAAALENIEKIEIRRASSMNSSTTSGGTADFVSCSGTALCSSTLSLSNKDLNWYQLGTVKADGASSIINDASLVKTSATLSCDLMVVPKTCTYVDNDAPRFPKGTILAYTIKATNKNPLKRDSLYSNPKTIKIRENGTDSQGSANAITSGAAVVGSTGELCKTDVGAKQTTPDSCQTIRPAYAKSGDYDGFDGKGNTVSSMSPLPSFATPSIVSGHSIVSPNQFTCNSGRGCYRCPDDGRISGSPATEWWNLFSWEPNSNGTVCIQKCNGTPNVINGTVVTSCSESSMGGPRAAITTAPNGALTATNSDRLVVDGSKNIARTASIGNQYCYAMRISAVPTDIAFSTGCNTVSVSSGSSAKKVMLKDATHDVTQVCEETDPAATKPYPSYSPFPHRGIHDTRTCVDCATLHGNVGWVYDSGSSDVFGQKCKDTNPTLVFTADNATTVTKANGLYTELKWATTNVKNCVPTPTQASPARRIWAQPTWFPANWDMKNPRPEPGKFNLLLSNTGTTTRTDTLGLTCYNAADVPTAEKTVTVNVKPALPTITISASPSTMSSSSGGSTTLTWTTTGMASQCTASGGWTGSKAYGSGKTESVTVPSNSSTSLPLTTSYTLTCTNDGGTASRTVNITTPKDTLPTLDLKVNGSYGPMTVNKNTTLAISWATANVSSCTQSAALTTYNNSKLPSGSSTQNAQNGQAVQITRTFTLKCFSPGGNSITKNVSVKINP